MKVKLALASLIIVVLLSLTSQAEEIVKIISIDEGMKAVRRFEGIKDLKLKYLGLDCRHGGGNENWVWPLYCFLSVDERLKGVGFSVCPYTGKVITRVDARLYRGDSQTGKIEEMIPPVKAYEIACRFIRERVHNFHPKSYDVSLSLIGHGENLYPRGKYKKWSRILSCLFLIRNFKSWAGNKIHSHPSKRFGIFMLSKTGEVVDYFGVDYPIKHFRFNPKINEEEAKEIALGHMKALNAIHPAKHIWTRPIGCAYAVRAGASYALSIDYPNYILPVWYVTVIYSMNRPDLKKNPYCGGHEHSVIIHAETGEVLGSTMVFGSNTPPVRIDEGYLKWYDSLPIQPLPWTIRVGMASSGTLGWFYPFPILKGGKLYFKPTFAWLLGVKVEKFKGGYLLKGVREKFIEGREVIKRGDSIWIALEDLAEASKAKFELDLEEKWLKIKPTYRHYE